MMILNALNMLVGPKRPKVELPPNFLRLAFQTSNPAVYQLDTFDGNTAAAEIVRKTIQRFNIKADPTYDDKKWYRLNSKGAAVIYTQAKSHGGKTELLIMTQATKPPETPHLESQDYVPVYVFEGVHDLSGIFTCNSIYYETAPIPKDAEFRPSAKTMVRSGTDRTDIMCGIAMGRKYFGQFMAGNRLSPDQAFPKIDALGIERLYSSYEEMLSAPHREQILQLAARLPS